MKRGLEALPRLEDLAYPLLKPKLPTGFEIDAKLFEGAIKTGDVVKLVTDRGELAFRCIGMKHGEFKRLVFVEDKKCLTKAS